MTEEKQHLTMCCNINCPYEMKHFCQRFQYKVIGARLYTPQKAQKGYFCSGFLEKTEPKML